MTRSISMESLVESNTLFNVISKDASKTQLRLQIEILELSEFYAAEELSRIGWFHGKTNPADALTKFVLSETRSFA